MFGRKKTGDVVAEPTPVIEEPPTVGKGRPTRKRKDAEAAKHRPLISGDPKADRIKAREAAAKQRRLMDEAMQTGDERHLPLQHKGVARRFARDYIDSRWTLGEFFLPAAMVVVVIMFAGTALRLPQPVILYAVLALYALVIIALLEAIVYSILVHRKAVAKFGKENVRGVRLYTAMRSMQLRRLRMPKPQVKRGEFPN